MSFGNYIIEAVSFDDVLNAHFEEGTVDQSIDRGEDEVIL